MTRVTEPIPAPGGTRELRGVKARQGLVAYRGEEEMGCGEPIGRDSAASVRWRLVADEPVEFEK